MPRPVSPNKLSLPNLRMVDSWRGKGDPKTVIPAELKPKDRTRRPDQRMERALDDREASRRGLTSAQYRNVKKKRFDRRGKPPHQTERASF